METNDVGQEYKEEFLRVWSSAFRVLLGWPSEKTLEWASRWAPDLDDPDSMFYHGTVERWILPVLIKHYIHNNIQEMDYLSWRRVFTDLIHNANPYKIVEEYDDADWEEIKRQICLLEK